MERYAKILRPPPLARERAQRRASTPCSHPDVGRHRPHAGPPTAGPNLQR